MKIYLATDHAGYEAKNALVTFLKGKEYEVIDCGPFVYDKDDDYPALIATAARLLADDVSNGVPSKAIVMGASGQGEAMVANRFKGVRCALYYGAPASNQVDMSGKTLSILEGSRVHNDANCLSIGARFLSQADIEQVVIEWLSFSSPTEERHVRRISQIDTVN